ncbi:MAG: GDSL-type esterase/lipase family protein [Planctomycetota bacterium]
MATTLAALAAAEFVLRLLPPSRPLGELSYELPDRTPIDRETAVGEGRIVPVPWEAPRPRLMIAPNQRYFLRYTDQDVLRRDWLDAMGRVAVENNRFGLRDRADLDERKPAGQRRLLCLGDSFTFGWGIPAEQNWVRLLEDELRRDGADVRTINCGAAGTVCVDEYWYGLKNRFHAFEPDAVVVTLCLNDLIPSSGLNLGMPIRPSGIRLLDLLRGAVRRAPLDLDPTFDWVGYLLALPAAEGTAAGLYDPSDKPFEAMWSQGVPQKSLRETKAWCDARKVPLMVVLWPFLQGLGPGRFYPFAKLHALVAADCQQAGIPFLDVLPSLQATAAEDLWVTPADPHPNPLAQRLALPAITAFVRGQTGW